MNATLLLAIATLALVVGPLLERVGRRLPGLAAWIDGATVGGVLLVSLLHLMPEAGAHLGWWAALLFFVGLALPTLAERLLSRIGQGLRFSLGFVVLALFLAHVVLEGAALASKAYDDRVALMTLLVIVGHRLPLGVLLWGEARKSMGVAWSALVLFGVGVVTLVGPMLVPVGEEVEFQGALSALLAGGLLHLVLQHRPTLPVGALPRRAQNAWSGLGLVTAVLVFVAFLPAAHGAPAHAHGASHLPERLLDLVLETSLPLLLGVFGAALIEAFLPPSVGRWLSRGSRLRQAVSGVAVGAPMPVCSCGVLPIYRSLSVRGVPPAAGLALLIAAPEIGIDSILLSARMLGGPTTLARVGCALLLALAVGWIVGGLRGTGPAAGASAADDEPRPRLPPARAIRRGLFETWGHLAPWILFGLVATALVEPWISTEWARSVPPAAQVLVLSLAGMPTYICAAAATPFAALLLVKGFAPGAVIAFLLTGPATNLTTFGALRKLHPGPLAPAFVIVALITTVLLGLGANALLAGESVPATLGADEHGHGLIDQVCAVLLGLLTLWVVFQEGPRAFLAQLLPEGSRRGHSHDHAPGEAH